MRPRALPASGFNHVRFLAGAARAEHDSRCVQLSDGPWLESGWPDLAWCKHFGIKARQLSWRSCPRPACKAVHLKHRTCNPRLRRPMPYPLGHGASSVMPARQVASWLTPARQVVTFLLHWKSEAPRGPCASHRNKSVLLSSSLLPRRGIWRGTAWQRHAASLLHSGSSPNGNICSCCGERKRRKGSAGAGSCFQLWFALSACPL